MLNLRTVDLKVERASESPGGLLKTGGRVSVLSASEARPEDLHSVSAGPDLTL